jgi:hypothetical protein
MNLLDLDLTLAQLDWLEDIMEYVIESSTDYRHTALNDDDAGKIEDDIEMAKSVLDILRRV